MIRKVIAILLMAQMLICSIVFAQRLEPLPVYSYGATDRCAIIPPFIAELSLQPPIVIDTQQSKYPGVVLKEVGGRRAIYRHASWRVTGHVGSTVRDQKGNIYVVPVPAISLDINPLSRRNRVYKIDGKTGLMQLFSELPIAHESTQLNPFGTVGLAIDCTTNSLYVSSIAGSTVREENGVIYQIDLSNGSVIDQFLGVDALGLGVFNFLHEKRLYYGDARSSSVYSLLLDKNGHFNDGTNAIHELSLLSVRNGNSTQARKLKFIRDQQQHVLVVSETEFSFRLLTELGRHFKHYVFALNKDSKEWEFKKIQF